jgi:hypothetical protein
VWRGQRTAGPSSRRVSVAQRILITAIQFFARRDPAPSLPLVAVGIARARRPEADRLADVSASLTAFHLTELTERVDLFRLGDSTHPMSRARDRRLWSKVLRHPAWMSQNQGVS